MSVVGPIFERALWKISMERMPLHLHCTAVQSTPSSAAFQRPWSQLQASVCCHVRPFLARPVKVAVSQQNHVMKLCVNRFCWEKRCLLFREGMQWQKDTSLEERAREEPDVLLGFCSSAHGTPQSRLKSTWLWLCATYTCSHEKSIACAECHSGNMGSSSVKGECRGEKAMFVEVFAETIWQSSRASYGALFSIEKAAAFFIWKMAAPDLCYSTFPSRDVWGRSADIYAVWIRKQYLPLVRFLVHATCG